MTHHCEQCGSSWPINEELTPSFWKNLCKSRAATSRIGAFDFIKKNSQLPDGVAKSIAMHLAVEGLCHECQQSLNSTGVVKCPKCDALNYMF
jgi:hypothetical protein